MNWKQKIEAQLAELQHEGWYATDNTDAAAVAATMQALLDEIESMTRQRRALNAEIERLRKAVWLGWEEIERLRAALMEIAINTPRIGGEPRGNSVEGCRRIAREALKDER